MGEKQASTDLLRCARSAVVSGVLAAVRSALLNSSFEHVVQSTPDVIEMAVATPTEQSYAMLGTPQDAASRIDIGNPSCLLVSSNTRERQISARTSSTAGMNATEE